MRLPISKLIFYSWLFVILISIQRTIYNDPNDSSSPIFAELVPHQTSFYLCNFWFFLKYVEPSEPFLLWLSILGKPSISCSSTFEQLKIIFKNHESGHSKKFFLIFFKPWYIFTLGVEYKFGEWLSRLDSMLWAHSPHLDFFTHPSLVCTFRYF